MAVINVDSRINLFGENGMTKPNNFEKAEFNRRQKRLKGIYQKVFCRVGHNIARELYKTYFKGSNCQINAKKLEQELEQKKRDAKKVKLETVRDIVPLLIKKRNSLMGSPSNSPKRSMPKENTNNKARSLSPLQKRNRTLNYRKWFMDTQN